MVYFISFVISSVPALDGDLSVKKICPNKRAVLTSDVGTHHSMATRFSLPVQQNQEESQNSGENSICPASAAFIVPGDIAKNQYSFATGEKTNYSPSFYESPNLENLKNPPKYS